MVFRGPPRPASLLQPQPLLLVLTTLTALSTLTSAGPAPPSTSTQHLPAEHRDSSDERDGRVWDLLMEESRSLMSAILPDKMAARAHDVLWSAPLHERAAREDRIPRYTVVAMAGPPMLQSHDTELLDAALSPAVAGDFGRKANGLSTDRVVGMVHRVSGGGRRRPEMTHEAEQMPNALKTEGHEGDTVSPGDAVAGQFGQRGSTRQSGSDSIGDEAGPSSADAGQAPSGAARPGDIISGFSSFPQTERVPYLQSVRDFDAEMKEEAKQPAQPTRPPAADEFTPPTFEEFPFDSLKMDSSTGGGPELNLFGQPAQDNQELDEQLTFDVSNFPNFPKFSFPRDESGRESSERPAPASFSAFGPAQGLGWFKPDQTGQLRPAEPEATRFPVFPGEQESADDIDMDAEVKESMAPTPSIGSNQHNDMLQMMKEDPVMPESLAAKKQMPGNINSATEGPTEQATVSENEITRHAGELPLPPVTEGREIETPQNGADAGNNQFENFREDGNYPDVSLGGFPGFPDIPAGPQGDFSAHGHTEEGRESSGGEDTTDGMVTPEEATAAPQAGAPSTEQFAPEDFVHPDIFPEVDLSPTAGDEFYARLETDPTFQPPTAPDFSFRAGSEAETTFQDPKFPELRTEFPQPESEFRQVEPEFPELAPLLQADEDAFQGFAEFAALERDNAEELTVFTEDEKMNDRRAVSYQSPSQFAGRRPTTYNHFSKSGDNKFENTFFKNDFTRVTTPRPMTTSPAPRTPRPHHPQGPPRPYPYRPRVPPGAHSSPTTTYRPAIFVNEGPKAGEEDEVTTDATPPAPSTSQPSGHAFFPHAGGNIPGYIPRPTPPRPRHPAGAFGEFAVTGEKPEPQPEQRIPGYIPRPSRPMSPQRAPENSFGEHVMATETSLKQPEPKPTPFDQPATYAAVEDVSSVSPEEQKSSYIPEDVGSTEPEADAHTDASPLATALPTSSDPTIPPTTSSPPSTQHVTFVPSTSPPTTTMRPATRRPYTFPPFRRRTTPASAVDASDATTSQFTPEFGTKITGRKPEAAAGRGGRVSAGRRRPGARRRPAGAAAGGRGGRRRPGARRRPAGGRRTTTVAPSTTSPVAVAARTVRPTVEVISQATEQPAGKEEQIAVATGNLGGDVHGESMVLQTLPQGNVEVDGFEDASVSGVQDELTGAFGQRQMPAGMMPEQVAPVEMVSEEEVPTEVMQEEAGHTDMVPEEMSPDEVVPEEMGPVETVPEDMGPLEIVTENVGSVEVLPEEMSTVILTPEEFDTAAFMPKEIATVETRTEDVDPVVFMPDLSETSQVIDDPITFEDLAFSAPAPTTDINEMTSVHIPRGQDTEGEDQVMRELPEISEVHTEVPQPPTAFDDSVVAVDEGEVASSVTESSSLGETMNESFPTEPSQVMLPETVNNVLEEELKVGPTVAAESRDFFVDNNSLDGFAVPRENLGEEVEVSAVLREELRNGPTAEDQSDVGDLFVNGEGSEDRFLADQSLQSVEDPPVPESPDTIFEQYSGPSSAENNQDVLIPSTMPEPITPDMMMPDGDESGPTITDAGPSPIISEMGMADNVGQQPEMTHAAPSQTTDSVPMPENTQQDPMLFSSNPMVMMPSMPTSDDSSRLPVMVDDMPPQMMTPEMLEQESDSHDYETMNGMNPDIMMATTTKTGEDTMADSIPLDSMVSQMLEGDEQSQMVSDSMPRQDVMPTVPILQDAVPMPQNVMPMQQDGMPMQQDVMSMPQEVAEVPRDVTAGQRQESPSSPEVTLLGDPQLVIASNGPDDTAVFAGPTTEVSEPTPEGFGPPKTYSLVPDVVEVRSKEDTILDNIDEYGNSQDFPSDEPGENDIEDASFREEAMVTAGDVIPNSDVATTSDGVQIHDGDAVNDFVVGALDYGRTGEITLPGSALDTDSQEDVQNENVAEVAPGPVTMPQAEGTTEQVESRMEGNEAEMMARESDAKGSEMIHEEYSGPEFSEEDDQYFEEGVGEDGVAGGAVDDTEYPPFVVDGSGMSEQNVDLDVRHVEEDTHDAEGIEIDTFTDSLLPTTESQMDDIEPFPGQDVLLTDDQPAPVPEADLQDISAEQQDQEREQQTAPAGFGPLRPDTVVGEPAAEEAATGDVTAEAVSGDVTQTYDVTATDTPDQPSS